MGCSMDRMHIAYLSAAVHYCAYVRAVEHPQEYGYWPPVSRYRDPTERVSEVAMRGIRMAYTRMYRSSEENATLAYESDCEKMSGV